MKIFVFHLLTLVALVGCMPGKSNLKITMPKKGAVSSTVSSASISSVQVINNQLVINGNGFGDVTNVKVNGNSLNENFSIESKTATKIIANSIRAFSFDVSKVFSLILSDANASVTFAIDFSLCNATLNGKGFNCAAPVADKDVLAYDAVSGTWKPRPASGLNYLGTFDASSNPGAGPAIQPAGAYYVISDDGNIGAVSFAVGDWLVSNGSTWQKIDNSSAVQSVHGRYGTITAQQGDYTLDLLGDVSFPTAPVAGKVLKFDGVNWVAGDDLSGGGAGSVTTAAIVNGAVTDAKIDTVSASKITGTINSTQIADGTIVDTDINTAANIAATKLGTGVIDNTEFNYLNGVTSAIQTQLDAKENSLATGGTTAQYFRGDKTLATLNTLAVPESTNLYFTQARAIASPLTGVTSTAGSITAADTILGAFGKLLNTQTDYVSKTANSTITGTLTINSIVGALKVPPPVNVDDAVPKSYVDGLGQWTKSGADIYRSGGVVGLGTTTPDRRLTIIGDGTNYGDDIYMEGVNSETATPQISLSRSRGTTAARTPVLANDNLGTLAFRGNDINGNGGTFPSASRIFAQAETDFATAVNGNLVFQTNSAGTLAEKMRITSKGMVGVGVTTPTAKVSVGQTSVSSGAVTLTAVNAANTFSTSAAITLNPGDLLIPTTTTAQARAVFIGGTGTSFTVSPPFSAAVTGETFTIYPAGLNVFNKLYVQATNGFLGIGTPAPERALHLVGTGGTDDDIYITSNTAGTTAGSLSMTRSRGTYGAETAVLANDSLLDINARGYNGTSYDIAAHISMNSEADYSTGASGDIRFGTKANTGTRTEKMRITGAGKVGIGTTAPLTNLHIVSAQPSTEVHPNRAGLILEAEGTSVGGRLAAKVNSDTESPLFVGYRARGTKAVPTALLSGDQITALSPVGYDGAGGWQTGAHIRFNTTENWSSTAIGSAISFRTPANGTTSVPERMRIDHNGNVGIGTSAPAVNLHIAGNVDGDVSSYLMNADDTGTLSRSMFLLGTGTSGLRYGYLAHHGAGFVTSGPYKARTTVLSGNDTGGLNFNGNTQIGLWVSSGEKMKILANGNVGIGVTTPDDKLVVYNGTTTGRYTATGWTHSSDARLKHDIHTITSATEKILKLRGVDYLLNNDPTNERQLGFIAQEVEPHFPEVVKTDKDGYKSMVYANLLAPLVEAFKDLYKKVTDIFMTTEKNTRAIASVNLKVKKLEEENAAKTKEIAELKAYLCAKDPAAKICK